MRGPVGHVQLFTLGVCIVGVASLSRAGDPPGGRRPRGHKPPLLLEDSSQGCLDNITILITYQGP
eukprot:87827-Pleurochrysis_carterae.AAC.1